MANKPLADSHEPMKLHRKDVQMKLSTANEEENCRLSDSYVTLNKEMVVYLMYRCLECSSGCCIRGKGKGGALSLRQECLTCRNCRVWTSQASDIPQDKVDDISLVLSCDDVGLQVSENVSVSDVRRYHRIYGCRECGTGHGGEPRHFKDFSVNFGDIVTFHKHGMSVKLKSTSSSITLKLSFLDLKNIF